MEAVGRASTCTENSEISKGMEGTKEGLRYRVPIRTLTTKGSMLSLTVTLSTRKN